MRSIQRLPEAIHNSMRSGGLIWDLTRIVEELIFNSLDAGSTKVFVAVWVGNYYVKVDDNGCGITRDGLLLLGERYTTSKIDHLALMDTGTENLDFHGEALSSISDISLLEILTKARGRPNGYIKTMKNSKCLFLGISDDRQDVGTTVTVRDIFYNHPVRRKHMESSPKKVLDSIKMSVLRIALVHVNVSFKVVDVESGDELFHTGPLSSPLTILSSYFGIENSAIFYKLNLSDGELKLSGYISDPREIFPPKTIQYVYINSRLVYKGPIHKLLNQLAAKFDLLSSWQPATSFQSEKRYKYDTRPAFILNLHCPRSHYSIITSERTSVEFKDWCPVLTFIENEVMRFWTKSISPVPDTLLVTSDKVMPDTFESGKKRCRKQNFQTPLFLDSPRKKKLCNDYDNMPDFEGFISSYGKICRRVPEINKNHEEASLLSEMDYPSQLCGGSVGSHRVTTSKEVKNDPSPCRVYSRLHVAHTFGKDEDDISSTFKNTLPAFDAKINNISIVNGVASESLEFHDDVHLEQDPNRIFVRSCSSGRSLLHERNSPAIDEIFQLGNDDMRIRKTCIDDYDSMGSKINLDICGNFPHCEEPILFQSSPMTQYDMLEIFEFPMWDPVKSSLVFGNVLPDSSNPCRKWNPSLQCFRSGWSPLTAEKNIGIKCLDDDEAIYGNLIEDCSKLGKDTMHGYYAQGEGEDVKPSNLNSKYGWLQQKGSFMNLSLDCESVNGQFCWGDDGNKYTSESYKIFRETDWSLLPSYGEESPRYYPLPSLHDTSPASLECEMPSIKNQKTTLDNTKMFIRSHSAPPFHRRKKKFMDLTNSTTMLSTKSNYWDISAPLLTEPSDSSCGKYQSKTRNFKCSQTSFDQYHPSTTKRPVIDCSIAERPVLKITPDVIAVENGGPQKMGQCVNMESVECLNSMEIWDSVDSRWKWGKCFLPSAGGSRSDNKKDHDIIIGISSDILNLSGDPLVPNSIDRTSLQDVKVLDQVDKKFIAVVAGKTLAIIDQHAADERIRLEDLRVKVLSGELKSITYLDGEQEMVLPEVGYQLLQNFAERIQSWGWICNIHSWDTSSFSKNLDFLHRQQTVVKLLAVPCILGVDLTDADLLEFLQQLADTDGSSTIPPSVHRVLNNKACRGAIMFGDTLLPSECSLIVEELKRTSLCFQCAHGRPTTVPLVNLDLLHNRIAKIGSPKSWHGLRHHKFSLEHSAKHLSPVEYANVAMNSRNIVF